MEKFSSDPCPQGDFVLRTIADWITRYRNVCIDRNSLGECSSDEVSKMARDLGVGNLELAALATKSPQSAALLDKLLKALGVESEAHANISVLHDLQRLCIFCGQKQRCKHELEVTTAAGRFRQYCPNAYTLDALLTEKGINRLG